jgi:hypothetical protein
MGTNAKLFVEKTFNLNQSVVFYIDKIKSLLPKKDLHQKLSTTFATR